MKQTLLAILTSTLISSTAGAAVTLTFDTNTQGVTGVSWNAGNGGIAWSPNYGGSIAVTSNVSGWSNPLFMLNLTLPAIQAEFYSAVANGGTLSFDYIISQADVTGYNPISPPGWFELVATANTDANPPNNGGWDQNVLGGPLGYYGGIPVGPTTRTVVMNIVQGGPVFNNMSLSFGNGTSGWNEFLIGINSQGGSHGQVTFYIDNLTISAIPEPSAALLGLGSAAALLARRRRR